MANQDINALTPQTGRFQEEDGTTFNLADMFEDVYDSANHLLKTTGVGGAGGTVIAGASYTVPTHSVVAVPATSVQVLAANVDANYRLLVNDSAVVIYLDLGVAAVMNQGIRLEANGGKYEMSKWNGNLYTGAVFGIRTSGAGTDNVLVTEGV